MFEVLFALLPMVILIIAMGICKWPGDKSSLLTLVITVMLATFAFGIPTREIGFTLINSTARACITILSVIWMAVFSYNILLDSGKIEVLRPTGNDFHGQECTGITDHVGVRGPTGRNGRLRDLGRNPGCHTRNAGISPVVRRTRESHRQQ